MERMQGVTDIFLVVGFPHSDVPILLLLIIIPALFPLLVGIAAGGITSVVQRNREQKTPFGRALRIGALVAAIGVVAFAIISHFIPGVIVGLEIWHTLLGILIGAVVIYGPYVSGRIIEYLWRRAIQNRRIATTGRRMFWIPVLAGYGFFILLGIWFLSPGIRWNVVYTLTEESCQKAGDILEMCREPKCELSCGDAGPELGCPVVCSMVPPSE